MGYRSGFTRGDQGDEVWCFGEFDFQIIDLSQYSGLRINGVNYYMDQVN